VYRESTDNSSVGRRNIFVSSPLIPTSTSPHYDIRGDSCSNDEGNHEVDVRPSGRKQRDLTDFHNAPCHVFTHCPFVVSHEEGHVVPPRRRVQMSDARSIPPARIGTVAEIEVVSSDTSIEVRGTSRIE